MQSSPAAALSRAVLGLSRALRQAKASSVSNRGLTTSLRSASTPVLSDQQPHLQWHQPPRGRRLRVLNNHNSTKHGGALHERPQPGIRTDNKSVRKLLRHRTPPSEFIRLCEQLNNAEDVGLLSGTDLIVWNVALQNRLLQGDVASSKALLRLVLSFNRENANEQLWTDLLFTTLRQPAAAPLTDDLIALLMDLKTKYGDDFVANVAVSVINGCANMAMFDQGAKLLIFLVEKWNVGAVPLPSRVLGNFVSSMANQTRYLELLQLTEQVLRSAKLRPDQLQAQFFIASFIASEKQPQSPDLYVQELVKWFHSHFEDEELVAMTSDQPLFTRVFGAAIQACVGTESFGLALRCYHEMTSYNAVPEPIDVLFDDDEETTAAVQAVYPDENIYVNVLKSCMRHEDYGLFRDVYYSMARDGVARDAGFGIAIRCCHLRGDIDFLNQVLDDAIAMERRTEGGWWMPVVLYNDALGAFAEHDEYEAAQDLFQRMLHNPNVAPDEITMLEMVENHRSAPLAEVFELMEVFLEWGMMPNLQVFTSLLAICARNQCLEEAERLFATMKDHGMKLDLKAYTAMAFIYGCHVNLKGIMALLREIEQQGVESDPQLFAYIINALHSASGIDVCFALLSEMQEARIRIPKGMFEALIDVGTRTGLVERSLNVAYHMECEGHTISAAQLQALTRRCGSASEAEALFRTFMLLHQDDGDCAREPFEHDVYAEIIDTLTRFNQRNAVPRVIALARKHGYDDLTW
ncbi:TPA: hypothetical protein N0F65_003496 [Lagenidium giganteum]|uniref:Pentatricopeptide repeat-containing protein n=1 Tax=Lagenidium giganteum TaxID=4803 RepID=A0AAV2YHH8_9STRA|nr:TPA: hypothetical protein N0F65_003496 [Lagenidium giganteum]